MTISLPDGLFAFQFQESESTANNVKKSISSFFDQVTEALSPTLNDDDEPEAVLITKDGAVTLTGLHKHLAELQANDDIYLVEPDLELAEKYQRWMEVVDQDQFTQQRLDRQLASSHILQEKYERLVPKDVTHMQFWQRYLFKRALLEDALANADLAERRAKQEAVAGGRVTSPGKQFVQTEQPKKVAADEKATDEKEVVAVDAPVEPLASIDEELSKLAEKELKWKEDPEISCAGVELSEEEQARLLAEYEQEIQERERKTSAAGQKTPQKKEQPAKGKKQAAGGGNKNQNQKGASGKNVGQRGNTKGAGATASKAAEKAPVKDDSDESWEKEFDLDE